jgi:hypothetical protein
MITVNFTGIDSETGKMERELNDLIRAVGSETLVDARQNTPVKSGRARRSWTKTDSKSGFVVENKVPYIERLEAGASRKAPKGIIGPTLNQIKGKYK